MVLLNLPPPDHLWIGRHSCNVGVVDHVAGLDVRYYRHVRRAATGEAMC
jgi:hypothetical protein